MRKTLLMIVIMFILEFLSSCNSTSKNQINADTLSEYRRNISSCENIISGSGLNKSNVVAYHTCQMEVKQKYYNAYSAYENGLDKTKIDLSKKYAANKITHDELAAGLAINDISYTTGMEKCDEILTNRELTQKNAHGYYRCKLSVKQKHGMYANDLDKALDLKKVELAEKLSAGTISYSTFNSEVAQYEMQINNIRISRNNAMQALEQQERGINANNAANAMGMMQRNQILQQQNNNNYVTNSTSNAPINTNCSGYGNTINCTSQRQTTIPYPTAPGMPHF